MAGSEAEERIRAKVEEMMRMRWPEARIIHELQLEEGGVRIDLAAVGPDFIAVAEIKSEKDTLKRLVRQVEVSLKVANEVWVCIHHKHEADLTNAAAAPKYTETETRAFRSIPYKARLLIERDGQDYLVGHDYALRVPPPFPSPIKVWQMLWTAEMSRELAPHGGGAGNMGKKTRDAVEWLSGGQIRRAVCRQLRQRQFPRADPAVPFGDASFAPDPKKVERLP